MPTGPPPTTNTAAITTNPTPAPGRTDRYGRHRQAGPGRSTDAVSAVVVGESPEQVTAREAAAAKAAADAEAARVAAEAAAAAAAADADLSTYQEIDDRTWALVAKDPKAHVGEKYVIYGKVTQFDSATGTSAFLARTGGESQKVEKSYNYDINTMITAKDAGAVADVVEDDVIKMYVGVTGSLTYDTQIGGSTTVPQAVINSHDCWATTTDTCR